MQIEWTPWHDKHSDKIELIAGIDCWIWDGCTHPSGHGRVSSRSGHNYAHRAAYAEYMGSIDPDLMVRHVCGCSSCVRPSHLAQGTAADNGKDTAIMFQTTSKLVAEDVRSIRRMYNDGVSLLKISEAHGIACGSVYPIVCYQNFPYVDPDMKGKHRLRSPRKLDVEKVRRIKDMLLSGVSQAQIATVFGVRSSTISRINTGDRWPNV